MKILINKQNDKLKFKKLFLFQSGIIPLSFLPTSGLLCNDATHMNNCTLTGTECYKYFGVILDSKMSCVQHITYVKSKVAKGIGIMYQARKYLD